MLHCASFKMNSFFFVRFKQNTDPSVFSPEGAAFCTASWWLLCEVGAPSGGRAAVVQQSLSAVGTQPLRDAARAPIQMLSEEECSLLRSSAERRAFKKVWVGNIWSTVPRSGASSTGEMCSKARASWRGSWVMAALIASTCWHTVLRFGHSRYAN